MSNKTKPTLDITVINAYGEVIRNAKARYYKRGSSGNPLCVEISAPGYITRRFWRFLEAVEVGVYMLLIDPKTANGPSPEGACLKNLDLVMRHLRICDQALVYYILGPPVEQRQDRGYFHVYRPSELLRRLDRTGTFKRVTARVGHKPHEEGYEIVGSWKTTRSDPVFQITLWRRRVKMIAGDGQRVPDQQQWGGYVAEMDIDLKSGLGHIGEVLKNKVVGKTRPYLVNQALAWSWGLISFTLQPWDGLSVQPTNDIMTCVETGEPLVRATEVTEGWKVDSLPEGSDCCPNCNKKLVPTAHLEEVWDLDWWCHNCDYCDGTGIEWPFPAGTFCEGGQLEALGFVVL